MRGFIRHCTLLFLKLESKIWTLSYNRDGRLATAVCNIGHSWAVTVASKGDAHLIHLSGTISVQTRTGKKRALMTNYIWCSIPVKIIKIKHHFEAFPLELPFSMVAHNVTNPLQIGSHITAHPNISWTKLCWNKLMLLFLLNEAKLIYPKREFCQMYYSSCGRKH